MPSKKTTTELKCNCGTTATIQCLANRNYDNWKCRACAIKAKWSDDNYRENRKSARKARPKKIKLKPIKPKYIYTEQHRLATSEAIKKKWQDNAYRTKCITSVNDPEYKKLNQEKSRKLWDNKDFSDRYKTKEFKDKMASVTAELWKDPNYRAKILATKSTPEFKEKMAAICATPEYKEKLSAAILKQPSVSNIQSILYSILDDLNVKYYREYNDKDSDRECLIGPWSFDCVIPRNDKKTLLIECNGDYIHSLPHKIKSDKAKHTYFERYLSDKYELRYVWEHEFAGYDHVVSILKYWLGINKIEVMNFDFKNLSIRPAPAHDYKPLLEKYHYLANAGRGGVSFGAYLNDLLIATCIFSPLARQNIKIGALHTAEVKELSRFCIHPSYQKKNFASWMISKCITKLDNEIKAIISYCDTTFNHDGTIYKASNFKFDAFVAPDYWYQAEDGWVIHKKTLYNKAVSLKLKESEYAEKFGFIKVIGKQKLRFIYER